MGRLLLGPGLLGGLLLLLWLWAVVDVILTDSMLVRNMQKNTWVFIVLFASTLGAVAWILFGRPENGSMVPGGAAGYGNNPYRTEDPRRYSSGPAGLEDSADWRPSTRSSRPELPMAKRSESDGGIDEESLAVRERKLMEREAELARREAELDAGKAEPDASNQIDEAGNTDQTDD